MSRKGENIYKRKDGRWEARYMIGRDSQGKIKYGYLYASTYSEVRKKQRVVLAQSKNYQENYPNKTQNKLEIQTSSVQEYSEQWIKHIQPGIKDSTYLKYEYLIEKHIVPHLGSKLISDLNYRTLECYVTFLLSKGKNNGGGLAPKTVTDILSVLKNIVNYAEQSGIEVHHACEQIHIRKNQSEIRVFNRQEQEKLCRYLCQENTLVNLSVLLTLFTGLRLGEVCALQWKNIKKEQGILHIVQTMQRIKSMGNDSSKTRIVITTPKSACSNRDIPIPAILFSYLPDTPSDENAYFLTGISTKFMEPRTLQNRFHRILEKCGIQSANFHTLRHTFATNCLEAGFDVKTLSEILGHASVNITLNRYVHPSFELKRKNMQRLSLPFSVV